MNLLAAGCRVLLFAWIFWSEGFPFEGPGWMALVRTETREECEKIVQRVVSQNEIVHSRPQTWWWWEKLMGKEIASEIWHQNGAVCLPQGAPAPGPLKGGRSR